MAEFALDIQLKCCTERVLYVLCCNSAIDVEFTESLKLVANSIADSP